MATYVPYNEDDSSPAQPPQQLEGRFSVDPSQGAPAKYTPYDPEAPAADPKKAALATLTQPREPWAGTYMNEAGKGVARGVVDFAKAIGNGMMPKGVVPTDMQPQIDPGIGQLKSMFDSAMAPRSDASQGEKYAGFGGEVAGGMMFPNMGAAAGSAKAGLGPALNSLRVPGLTGINSQFPVVAKGGEQAAESGGGLFSDMLSNSFPKELADIGMKALNIPRLGRYAIRGAWGAIRNKMSSGATPAESFEPMHNGLRRMAQGSITPLLSDDQ